jgi:hypothetical protein
MRRDATGQVSVSESCSVQVDAVNNIESIAKARCCHPVPLVQAEHGHIIFFRCMLGDSDSVPVLRPSVHVIGDKNFQNLYSNASMVSRSYVATMSRVKPS